MPADVAGSSLEVMMLAHRTFWGRADVCTRCALLQRRLLQPKVHCWVAAQRWSQGRLVARHVRQTGVYAGCGGSRKLRNGARSCSYCRAST
eukprot:COSAG01_NODE_22334_length_860_cov_0.838371_1_plen_90_part_10